MVHALDSHCSVLSFASRPLSSSAQLQRKKRGEQHRRVGRMRIIVRKSAFSAAPGMAEAGHTHEARDDAAVDAVIIGYHRAIASEGAGAGIGSRQRIGGARGGRQATIENEILMHELDGGSGRD